ncbi:alpha/beta hydrolase [Aliikangiella sp. IMCC44359]|uniref:alpha/beta hydrolase n=1 Tax=Aliikangiella sp. IMCC44359 TaxID=3459125 RepID=UPI00403AF718
MRKYALIIECWIDSDMKIISQAVKFEGEAGVIQGTLDLPSESVRSGYISVNCHPHSLHGGSMTNKVIHTVSRSIAGLGIPSLRFNFRGVGQSAGEYDEGQGEQADLKAAVDWMQQQYPGAKLILSGFSFGSFVSASSASSLCPVMLLSVAPPVKRFDFSEFQQPDCNWVVIMGTEDELVEYSAVEDWVDSFASPPELITMQGASHFFHGRLVELREHIEKVVGSIV